MNLGYMAKAIAGCLTSMVVVWLAHYGVTLSPLVHDALASIALAVVSYVVTHLAVYFTTNKPARVAP